MDKKKLKLKWLLIFYTSFALFAIPYSIFNGIWPIIASDIKVAEVRLGILSGIYLASVSIFLSVSSALIYRFGSRVTVGFGILMQGIGILIFSLTDTFVMCAVGIVCISCGEGLINTTANFFISAHYDAKRMAWLHAVWGLGSCIGPFAMAFMLLKGLTYHQGFLIIFPIYVVYAGYMLCSKIADVRHTVATQEKEVLKEKEKYSLKTIFSTKNAIIFFLCMFMGEFLQSSMAVWYSTYVVMEHNVDKIVAANILSMYFVGVTASRVCSGFIVEKLGERKVVMSGFVMYTIITLILIFDIHNVTLLSVAGVLLGVSMAPAYPFIMNLAKQVFDKDALQGVVGFAGSAAKAGAFMSTILITNFTTIFSMKCFSYITFIFGVIGIVVFFRFSKGSNK